MELLVLIQLLASTSTYWHILACFLPLRLLDEEEKKYEELWNTNEMKYTVFCSRLK